MNATQTLLLAALALYPTSPTPAAPAKARPADDAREKRELLSDHQTVSRFDGISQRKCRGLTSLCPDECGHSGDFASFTVLAYVRYEKTGEYGDPKATEFVFQVRDNHGAAKAPKAVADAVAGLKEGALVLLDWRHEYVTRREAGGSSSSPERPVTRIKPITKEEAERRVREAEKK